MNRNRLVAGSVVLLFIVLLIAGIRWLVRFSDRPGHISQKTFVDRLGYCGPAGFRPCILSFSQIGDGQMQVDVLVPSSAFPDFYLTIYREGQGYRYECEESEDSRTQIQCLGAEIFPGELLQFSLITTKDERVLAEGQFTLIGLLLSTPVAGPFEATIVTEPASGFPTPTLPSYPNSTSYPNP